LPRTADDWFNFAHAIFHQTEAGEGRESDVALAYRRMLRTLAIEVMNEVGLAHSYGLDYTETDASTKLAEVSDRLHETAIHSGAACPICQPSTSQAIAGGDA
jgi:hypothetical protein